MHGLCAEVFFVNIHLWHIFPFYSAFLPTAMFALFQLSHVCSGIYVTRSSNFRGSYNIVKILDILMAMKPIRGQFSSMSRVCRMAYLSLSVSWSGHRDLGIGTPPALTRGQSPSEMGLPAVLALTALTPQWCFLHCGTVAMQWAQSMLVAPLSLPASASPFPWWERPFPLGRKRDGSFALCWRELLFILGHPICKQKQET